MPMPKRFRFGERADLAVFRGEIAVANVHDARVGVRGAAQLRGFERPVGEVRIMDLVGFSG